MTHKLLVMTEVSPAMAQQLTPVFELIHMPKAADVDAMIVKHGAHIVGAVTGGHCDLSPEIMARLPNLAVMASNGVGYDGIDVQAAGKQGVVVTHTPDVLNDEVANCAILLWMAVARQLVPNDAYVRAGRWPTDGETPLTTSIQNRTVGIVGYGRIGQTIGRRAAAFDAEVLYHARSAKDAPGAFCADLTQMARRADVLIVITPGGAGTRHLIDADVLAALGPSGILVNVARGSVVDETALVAALQSGALGGAGLDVFENEPQVPVALMQMDNVVLTPHIGSATQTTRDAMAKLVCDNLLTYVNSGTVLTPVPEHKEMSLRELPKDL